MHASRAAGLECLFGALAANAVDSRSPPRFRRTSRSRRPSSPSSAPRRRTATSRPHLGSGASITQVDYPTEFSGSNKIKLTGVPATCTNSDFKAKAKVKAKKVTRTYAYLKGPKSEFGTPLPVSGGQGRIAKKKGRKLKVTIQAGTARPRLLRAQIAAKRKGGQLKRTATFQVCGPTFGI